MPTYQGRYPAEMSRWGEQFFSKRRAQAVEDMAGCRGQRWKSVAWQSVPEKIERQTIAQEKSLIG